MAKLSDITGIKPKHKARLKKAKVRSIDILRKKGATPKGRAELQSDTGIDRKLILDWVNRADLLRVKGVGSEYSDLLVKTGVHNIGKLAKFEPKKLRHTLVKKNSALGNQVSRMPGVREIRSWVTQARAMASGPAGPGGGRPSGSARPGGGRASEPAGPGGGRPSGPAGPGGGRPDTTREESPDEDPRKRKN